jgi:hypothetical protein
VSLLYGFTAYLFNDTNVLFYVKSKITLAQLETFPMKTAHIPHGFMNVSKYQEYIFGMLFL